jgi:DNA topoisomerase-1
MAKKARTESSKSLVIVESPAKARTISKFLGKAYQIEASIGHVRDLPEGTKELPEQYKKTSWGYLGVDVDDNFRPVYVIPKGKSEQVRRLKKCLKDAHELLLATDEDREGEAISWHLREILNPKVPVHRLVFHEITKEAIEQALGNPRTIDENLVKAQETRRIVDRLYGYDVSPLLWKKVRPRLSAGRVQSVAVKLIVEREKERRAFISAAYWDLSGTFARTTGESFQAELVRLDGRRLASGKDFDPATGNLKDAQLVLLDEAQAQALSTRLQGAAFLVQSLDDKPYVSRPSAPFTTSTLQQEANRKLRFTARRTMKVAQSLYENGYITYMRTDSTNLAAEAVEAARNLVASEYGTEYLPPEPRVYRTKVKNAQEAHEAIRPAGHPFTFPEALRGTLSDEEFKIYDLIWKRTVACQMADAQCRRITITLAGDGAEFQASGTVIEFPGYLRAYVEGSDDPQQELADRDVVLPAVSPQEKLDCRSLDVKPHATQPPARYTEATLTRAMEDLGIGRPSTYATIIETIQARDYVVKRGNALVPTWVAFAVNQLLETHLTTLVDYKFTAEMEDDLDAISRGERGHVDYLSQFYFGDGRPGLKPQLASKVDEIDPRTVCSIPIGAPAGEPPIVVRVGKFGPFLEQGDRRASIPDKLAPDELDLKTAMDLLSQSSQGESPLGMCPQTGQPVFLKQGRFGPYVQRGAADNGKPQNASLLKGMKPEDVTLELALKLLSLPRELGPHPESGDAVIAQNGRYGPYIKCGKETRSLPPEVSPLDVDLEQALFLLSQPKPLRRGFGAPREPLRVLGDSPVTGQPVRLLEGRYGKYVSDGTTNATLPKGAVVEAVQLNEALELLAARAGQGPPRGRKAPRRTTRRTKAEAPAEAAASKAPKRKPAARRPAKKTLA